MSAPLVTPTHAALPVGGVEFEPDGTGADGAHLHHRALVRTAAVTDRARRR